jgi:hypothetical protein
VPEADILLIDEMAFCVWINHGNSILLFSKGIRGLRLTVYEDFKEQT